ncbi:MAG: Nitrogen permease regulator 3 [Phylliscum demangeonii]|nr:MAG: Nitrogen permease regulator 3 [Phylliscum demangeonii]
MAAAASTVPLPPNPCLIAILLIVNADRAGGPRLVFHYPLRPRDDLPPVHSICKGRQDAAADITAADDKAADVHARFQEHRGGPYDEDDWSSDEELRRKKREEHGPSKEKGPAWETVFGFSADALAWMLSPHRKFAKQKLEVGIEPLTYLGCPHFLRDDGWWRRRRVVPKAEPEGAADDGPTADGTKAEVERKDDGRATSRGDVTPTPTSTTVTTARKEADGGPARTDPDDGQGSGERATKAKGKGKAKATDSEESEMDAHEHEHEDHHQRQHQHQHADGGESSNDDDGSTTTEEERRAMSMFNVVFVMQAPLLEHNLRVREMYNFVVKRFAKALKYEQARSNWIWRESEKMLGMRERAKEDGIPMRTLWDQVLAGSGLAKVLSEVYLAISGSQIAHVVLNTHYDISLQIPQLTSLARLPTAIEPQLPGLWLTTADRISPDDEMDAGVDEITLAKLFGLLLLDEVDNIIRDMDQDHHGGLGTAAAAGAGTSHPLAEFVRAVKPTMSFYQLSQTLQISIAQTQMMARHLIYWRRARAIPPLHRRDKYVVSANADLDALPAATTAFARRFPTFPSLPEMLGLLSGHPRSYSTLIPSADHREAYMQILAWLMQGGWVTQLRIFGWVRVSRAIKALVRAASHDAGDDTADTAAAADDDDDDDPTDDTILLDPRKANSRQSRWLDAIRATTFAGGADDDDEPAMVEVRALWPRLVKYCNGKHALEDIPVLEGLSRKEVWRVLVLMEQRGVLVVVRHW